MHNVDLFVNLDNLIAYTVCHHGTNEIVGEATSANDDGHKKDIGWLPWLHVEISIHIQGILGVSYQHATSFKKKNLKVNEVRNNPDIATVGDVK
jgi:hypothetical protein